MSQLLDKTTANGEARESAAKSVAMTPQQRRFAASSHSRLASYKSLSVGEKGWCKFFCFELYNLFLLNLPTMFGLGLRQLIFPRFVKAYGHGSIIGRSVAVRHPHRIALGSNVVIDDNVTLDVRVVSNKNSAGIEIGNNVFIGRHSIVSAKDASISLGDAVNISSHCRIATSSGIDIGSSVLIAAYVYIGPGNHSIDASEMPLIEQPVENRGGVRIGAGSWIGTRATILDGVTIGRDAIVGAHSLVNSDVPERAIVAGTPARILRYRDAIAASSVTD